MKRKFYTISLLLLALVGVYSCKKTDDTQVWNALWQKTTQLEALYNNLNDKCKALNDNVDALQAIVDALEKNEKILAFTEVKDGYVITFGDGKTVTIHNNGTTSVGNSSSSEGGNSQEHTPIVSVTKDEDGNYYWTVDGEIIKDANGDKIPVNDINNGGTTQSGVTPRFKIENGDWYVSYDDGNTYTYVGKATGDNGTGTAGQDGVTPRFKIENGDWYVSYDDGNTYTYVGKATGDNGTGTAGQDGVTPRFKIENGDWYVSYDDGSTYTYVGKATGDKGDNGTNAECVFKSVTQDANNVYFTLADDTVITIPKDNGKLPGIFSVSSTKKVQFSQGNLQYQASTDIWRFAKNQWDYVGEHNSNIAADYDGWIDLFGWGTSGWNSGAKAYQPYSITSVNTDYYPGNSETTNLTGTYANADWGVYNAISNGGNVKGFWRVLTDAEWAYLFNSRNNAAKLYGYAVIGKVEGLIILPDDFECPYGLFFTPGVNLTIRYTFSDWKVMEANGAVFLPAAGSRSGTGVFSVGAGYYWSSTYSSSNDAYGVYFKLGNLHSSDYSNRCTGCSVRLVQDVE